MQRELYLIWIEIRKLKIHPALLIPGWTGFNITVQKKLVVVESTIEYLDTPDSPATDLKTTHEVLCRRCEIRDLTLKQLCVYLTNHFMQKQWRFTGGRRDLLVMMGGFHLLMMLLGVIGLRFGEAGLNP